MDVYRKLSDAAPLPQPTGGDASQKASIGNKSVAVAIPEESRVTVHVPSYGPMQTSSNPILPLPLQPPLGERKGEGWHSSPSRAKIPWYEQERRVDQMFHHWVGRGELSHDEQTRLHKEVRLEVRSAMNSPDLSPADKHLNHMGKFYGDRVDEYWSVAEIFLFAENGSPMAASAIVLGVFDSNALPVDKLHWLTSGGKIRAAQALMDELINRLREAGGPDAPELIQQINQGWGTLSHSYALIKSGKVAVAGPPGSEPAVLSKKNNLKVEGITNDQQILCSATGKIPALGDFGRGFSQNKWSYAVPPHRLMPR